MENSYIAFMAPGMIALSSLGGAITGGSGWLNERREGTIKEYLAGDAKLKEVMVVANDLREYKPFEARLRALS